MADSTTSMAPGTELRFGTLLFIVGNDGALVWQRPPASSKIGLLTEAVHDLRTTAPEGLVTGDEELCDRLGALLGPDPSHDDECLALSSVANVASQVAGGAPLPFGLQNVAATAARPSSPRARDEASLPESMLVGMVSTEFETVHVDDSDDSGSRTGSGSPSNECLMATVNETVAANSGGGDEVERMGERSPTHSRLAPPLANPPEIVRTVLQSQTERRGDGGRARANARNVHRRIVSDSTTDMRVSQNVAAAAALLRVLPIPETPEARRAYEQARQHLNMATAQQANSLSRGPSRRSGTQPSARREATMTQATAAPTVNQPAGSRTVSVRDRLGGGRDARHTIEARRRIREAEREPHEEEQAYERPARRRDYDRQEGRNREDRALDHSAPGPRAFTVRVRNATIPTRYRTPTSIPKYSGDTDPSLWLEDYRLTAISGGATDDLFIIRNCPYT